MGEEEGSDSTDRWRWCVRWCWTVFRKAEIEDSGRERSNDWTLFSCLQGEVEFQALLTRLQPLQLAVPELGAEELLEVPS